ncbi:hypothetical protein [Lacinutrix sp. Bg11-31]|nr:hypothetical protein [Lacinutrix sp. Bg11-31]
MLETIIADIKFLSLNNMTLIEKGVQTDYYKIANLNKKTTTYSSITYIN